MKVSVTTTIRKDLLERLRDKYGNNAVTKALETGALTLLRMKRTKEEILEDLQKLQEEYNLKKALLEQELSEIEKEKQNFFKTFYEKYKSNKELRDYIKDTLRILKEEKKYQFFEIRKAVIEKISRTNFEDYKDVESFIKLLEDLRVGDKNDN